MPRTTIKEQAIADFVEEFKYLTKKLEVTTDALSTSKKHIKDDEPPNPDNVWGLKIDGSFNVIRSSTSVVLESLTGEKINYALRLEFPALNNKA